MPRQAANKNCSSPPVTLESHPFYGMALDEEQKKFRDAIWDESARIIFVNAKAGTGKTTIAVATSVLMVQYGKYDELVYVVHSVGDAQGYLPGTISEKSAVLHEPLYQAQIESHLDPSRVIHTEAMTTQKNGEAFVTAITDTYLRGSNIGANSKAVLIIDEAQNFDEASLRKTLTRACDNTKVIVIGHDGQIDLSGKHQSGFIRCLHHFMAKGDSRVRVCELNTNHRGFISTVADEPWL